MFDLMMIGLLAVGAAALGALAIVREVRHRRSAAMHDFALNKVMRLDHKRADHA